MPDKNLNWHKVAEDIKAINFPSNNIAVVELKGKKICLGKHNNEIFGFAYTCPHAGGILATGYIDALGNIVCPLHRYKYDMKNGRNVSGEGYYLKHWPVELRPDGVYIGMEDSGNFWNIFK